MAHSWSVEDDILAYYISKYSDDVLVSITTVANRQGMTESSLKMRIANFHALAGNGKLKNAAELSKKIFDEFKMLNQIDHRDLCLKILSGQESI